MSEQEVFAEMEKAIKKPVKRCIERKDWYVRECGILQNENEHLKRRIALIEKRTFWARIWGRV